ncbi:hypothetical protein NL676_016119 [Syzygium grande]|nr:hypothetical protein NL676_016119 [Syzygium grande]
MKQQKRDGISADPSPKTGPSLLSSSQQAAPPSVGLTLALATAMARNGRVGGREQASSWYKGGVFIINAFIQNTRRGLRSAGLGKSEAGRQGEEAEEKDRVYYRMARTS